MKSFLHCLMIVALLFAPFVHLSAQDQNGDIKVTVLDEKGAPMIGAIVHIVAGGPKIGGATDLNGNYTFRSLTPGSYDVEANMLNYKRYVKTGILVSAGQTAYAEFPMQVKDFDCDTCYVIIKATRGPIDQTYSTVQNINAGELKRSPDRNDITQLVTGTCSSCSTGKNGQLVMRGSRENATTMYVDGEKLYGGANGVPAGSIEQVTILSGGIPAAYGDMTGGVIIITTKSYYTGISAKQAMYDTAAAQAAAAKRQEDAKSGKRTENKDQIIEQDQPAPAPAGGQAPAEQTPAPKND